MARSPVAANILAIVPRWRSLRERVGVTPLRLDHELGDGDATRRPRERLGAATGACKR